jgi:hypothetical protein
VVALVQAVPLNILVIVSRLRLASQPMALDIAIIGGLKCGRWVANAVPVVPLDIVWRGAGLDITQALGTGLDITQALRARVDVTEALGARV